MKCPSCHFDNPSDTNYCGRCAAPLVSPKDVPLSQSETLRMPTRELTGGSTFTGRYQIIEELGKGGMGRVYKVFDTKIKEKIALKLIRSDIAVDPETIERFSNELKLARKIRHKNVCGMFDLGEAEGAHFITMEYVHGEDLKSMIQMTGSLAVGTVLSIGKQICDGLAEAHALGIVHRDLKPQNIMIDKGGNVKIMDFGIARSISARGLTGAGVLIGTPEYMSPEQAEAKEVDARSDIYSLGIVLYEMATGRVPFEGDTALSVAMKHKAEIPKNPKEFNPHIPDDLGGVILKCLEKDKAERYQSAAALRDELDRIEKGIPTTQRVVPERKTLTSREITVKFTLRKVLLPGLAVLAVIVAAIFFWPRKASNLDPKVVAVAVFENKTGDPKLDPVGSMAADRIMQGLSQVGQFTVATAPTAEALSAAAKGKDRLRALAELTKAGKIVHGDYYLQGAAIQFHAWVEDMAAKKNLYSPAPVSGPAADPAAALEPLRLKLMGGLAAVFDPALKDYVQYGSEPTNFESYRETMDGMRAFMRGNFKDAIDHLLKAADRDPQNASALVWAAIAYYNSFGIAKADELAQKLEISRADLSTGDRAWLDWLKAMVRGDNETALRIERQEAARLKDPIWIFLIGDTGILANYPREAAAALSRLDPSDPFLKEWPSYWTDLAMAHHMLGNYKDELKVVRRARKLHPNMFYMEIRPNAALGRTADLEKLFEEGQALSPAMLGSLMLSAGLELRAHGFREESVRIIGRAQQWYESRPEKDKASVGNRNSRAQIFYVLGKWAEAKDLYEGLRKASPNALGYLGFLGAIAARMGDREGALKISQQLDEDKRPYLRGGPTAWRARIAALLGDKEGAVSLLRDATREGYSFTSLHLIEDFESLADYPPFVQLMKPKG